MKCKDSLASIGVCVFLGFSSQHARELETRRREQEERERRKQREVQMELERQLKEAETVRVLEVESLIYSSLK